MDEEKIQIVKDNLKEVDVSAVMKPPHTKEYGDWLQKSNNTINATYDGFHALVTKAAGKAIDMTLNNFVPDVLPNFSMEARVVNDEAFIEEEQTCDGYQLHGFFIVEADENTYINIMGVDIRVKFNHMYLMPKSVIYKYIRGQSVKLVTMKWKLKSNPLNKDTMKEWR